MRERRVTESEIAYQISNRDKFAYRGLRGSGDTYAWWERLADAGSDAGRILTRPRRWSEHLHKCLHNLSHLFDSRPIMWSLRDIDEATNKYSLNCTICDWESYRT